MWRKVILIIFVVVMLGTFGLSPASAGKANDTLNIGFQQEFENLDSYFNMGREVFVMARHIWDSLLYRDPDTLEIKPLLATSFKIIGDNIIEFELRKGVKFHNGEKFDADDVVYTYNFIKDPANGIKQRRAVSWIAKAEKLGEYKVQIKMKEPFPLAIQYIAGPLAIYPNEYYAKVGSAGMGLNPVGTGPFKVTEVVPGQKVVMEKNQDYFEGSPKGKPGIGKIVVQHYPEVSTQIAEMMVGNVDWTWGLGKNQAEKMMKMPKFTGKNSELMRIGFIPMNSTKGGPLSKLKVRQAISHAVDRQALINLFFGNVGQVVHAACSPIQFGCTNDVVKYEYNSEKAKKLLAEAGYADGFKISMYVPVEYARFAEGVIGYLDMVGIKAKLNRVQYSVLWDKWLSGTADTLLLTWGSWSISDISAITSSWFGGNFDVWHDPIATKHLKIVDTTMDQSVRMASGKKGLQYIAEQAYWLPLFTWAKYYVYSNNLDFTASADELPRFFLTKWK